MFTNSVNMNVRFEQSPFYIHSTDGAMIQKKLSTNKACAVYIELSIENITQDYVKSVSGVAQHTHSITEGSVDLELSYQNDFMDSKFINYNGTFAIESIEDVQNLKDNKIRELFIRLVQHEAVRIHESQEETFSTLTFVASYNMKISSPGSSNKEELLPIPTPVTSQSIVARENGTRRYGYNFYFNQPEVTSYKNLDNNASSL